MNWFTFFSIALTIIALAVFLGIVFWAYSRGRKNAFDEAAQAPFALPDNETEPSSHNKPTN